MDNNGITYILKWSNIIDDKFLEDFLSVLNAVFGGFNKQTLQRKITNNVYGSSLLSIAYCGNVPIGVDAMIRNDIKGRICFETIDTCVLENYRGLGVFSTITKREVKEIIDVYPEACIYGFPNANSYPGYIKMKWVVQCELFPTLFLPPFFNKNNPDTIDLTYGKWLSNSDQKFYCFKWGRNHYLIKQGRKYYQLIGRIDSDAALIFEREKHPGMIKCFSKSKPFFINNKGYYGSIVTYEKVPFEIPYWKCDTFLN